MNKHDSRPFSSSGALVIVLVLLVVMLFGGLAAVGAGLMFWTRVRHQTETRMVMQQRAISEMERARAEADEHQARVEAELQRLRLQKQQEALEMQDAGKTEIVLVVAQDGEVTLDGVTWTEKLLQALIVKADPVPKVLLRVDPRCQFADVLAIQTELREAEVTDLQLAVSEPGIDEAQQ